MKDMLRYVRPIKYGRFNDVLTGVKISRDVVIEGRNSTITIGPRTAIEPGVVLSTKDGGTISIGERCTLRRGTMVLSCGGDIVIGDHCRVNVYTILYGHGGLTIGDHVRIAAHCVIIPANHGFKSLDIPIGKQPLTKKGIEVAGNVWIGANATILDGVHIGEGAVIGAGSVVTKDITPYSVNVGNPAHEIKSRLSV